MKKKGFIWMLRTGIQSPEYGVTLVELLVVLAIIMVLAVAGYAQYRATEGARVRAASEQVASTMRRAVQVASGERTPYRVRFLVGTGTIQVHRWVGYWTDVTQSFFPSWMQEGWKLPAGAVIAATTFGEYYVINPLTVSTTAELAVSTTAGTVTVRAPGGTQLQVVANNSGEVVVIR